MASSLFVFVLFFLFAIASPISSATTSSSSRPLIGVTYSSRGTNDHFPHQQQLLVTTLESLKINSIRLIDSDPDIIRSFSYSSITLLITIPNSLLPSIASNQTEALRWLNRHVTPFYPRVHISLISVGNNILSDQDSNPNSSEFLLSAMWSVRNALDELGIENISVSTTFSFVDIISNIFPPSSSEFQESVAESLMKPILNFLSETNSSFLINIYPYNVYRTSAMIPLGYAIFQEQPFMYRDDLVTGVRYRNLFDVMVDSVITAMSSLGHEDVPVIVTETGWPSVDETKDMDASKIYAEMYLKGLVRHVRSGAGTPLRKNAVAETYIFELFDKDGRESSGSVKRQWGILNPDMSQKFYVDFASAAPPRGPDGHLWRFLVCVWLLGMIVGSAVRVCDFDNFSTCAWWPWVLGAVLGVILGWKC